MPAPNHEQDQKFGDAYKLATSAATLRQGLSNCGKEEEQF